MTPEQRVRNLESIFELARKRAIADGVPADRVDAFLSGVRKTAGMPPEPGRASGRAELAAWFMWFAGECRNVLPTGSSG